jgi:hemolysin activation/secretion protein
MREISQIIVTWYREHNHPMVDVIFPEQDISTGTLQVVVMEFRIGQVKVEGNRWFSDDKILSGVREEPGDVIVYDKLQEDLAWVNQNPFRSVDGVFEKGQEAGTTNLDLKTQDQFPVRVYAGYDNTGTPIVGRSRWNLGANWGDAFWDNQLLSYQFTTSDDFWVNHGEFLNDPNDASFYAHSIDDVIPLPWHDKIDIFGTYTREKPQLTEDFNQVGHSGQASFRYIHTLPTLSWLGQEAQFGYDYKTTNNNLEFGGASVYTSSTDVNQFLLIYKGEENDLLGQTAFTNNFVYSPGGLTAGNNTAAFRQSGISASHADYLYDNITVTRTTPLFWSTSAVTRLTGQLSNGNLLPSEELGAGGENSVRGYNEWAAAGSQGMLFSQELRSPSFNVSKDLFAEDMGDQTQFLAFWDFGGVGDNVTQPNQPSSTQLSSVGLGLRYALGNHVSATADYGWQLIKPPNAANLGSLAHVAITVGY